jgi:hypothetical protein
LPKLIQSLQSQVLDTQKQLELRKPSGPIMQGTAGPYEANTNPYAFQPVGSKVGQTMDQGIAPEGRIISDVNNDQYIYDPKSNTARRIDTGGSPGNQRNGGTGGGGSAPPANAPTRTQSGFTQPVPGQADIEKEVKQTRDSDSDYGLNRHINDQLLKLSGSTTTGPGSQDFHNALGGISSFTGGNVLGNEAADYQTIDAYLQRQSALALKSLPETNAGLATAQAMSGKTSMEPGALQTKVKLLDALTEGAHQYRQGLDRLIGSGTSQDLSKYQAYKSAWANNFDPRVYLYHNAKTRDKAEGDSFAQTLSPAEARDLDRKRKNLALLAAGTLPTQ